MLLPGPTGERNTYAVLPRRSILCVASDARDYLSQLAAVLATGARAVWPISERTRRLAGEMPAAVRDAIDMVEWWSGNAEFDMVLHHGSAEERTAVLARVAARDGPIASVLAYDPGEEAAHPTGTQTEVRVRVEGSVRPDLTTLLFDPQTSGGLLAAVPPDALEGVRAALEAEDVPCWEIGEVSEGGGIVVEP